MVRPPVPGSGDVEHDLTRSHGHSGFGPWPGTDRDMRPSPLEAIHRPHVTGGGVTLATPRAAVWPSANRVTFGLGSDSGSLVIASHTPGGISIDSPPRTAAAAFRVVRPAGWSAPRPRRPDPPPATSEMT